MFIFKWNSVYILLAHTMYSYSFSLASLFQKNQQHSFSVCINDFICFAGLYHHAAWITGINQHFFSLIYIIFLGLLWAEKQYLHFFQLQCLNKLYNWKLRNYLEAEDVNYPLACCLTGSFVTYWNTHTKPLLYYFLLNQYLLICLCLHLNYSLLSHFL